MNQNQNASPLVLGSTEQINIFFVMQASAQVLQKCTIFSQKRFVTYLRLAKSFDLKSISTMSQVVLHLIGKSSKSVNICTRVNFFNCLFTIQTRTRVSAVVVSWTSSLFWSYGCPRAAPLIRRTKLWPSRIADMLMMLIAKFT